MSVIDRRVIGGGHIAGIDHVLHPKGQSVQWPLGSGMNQYFVQFAGFADGQVGIEKGPGLDGNFPGCDPSQARSGQLLNPQFASCNQGGCFGSSQLMGLRGHSGHGVSPDRLWRLRITQGKAPNCTSSTLLAVPPIKNLNTARIPSPMVGSAALQAPPPSAIAVEHLFGGLWTPGSGFVAMYRRSTATAIDRGSPFPSG